MKLDPCACSSWLAGALHLAVAAVAELAEEALDFGRQIIRHLLLLLLRAVIGVGIFIVAAGHRSDGDLHHGGLDPGHQWGKARLGIGGGDGKRRGIGAVRPELVARDRRWRRRPARW